MARDSRYDCRQSQLPDRHLRELSRLHRTPVPSIGSSRLLTVAQIDWQPETLNWLIDGNIVGTLKASDAVMNGTSNYPSTPSRIQLSIWPAGISSEPQGTVSWAGGMINWQDPDYLSAGHFYALVQSINVTCHDPTIAPFNATSYVYGTNSSAFTPSIAFSNASTVNAARGMMQDAAGPFGMWTVACAVAFSLLGAVLA